MLKPCFACDESIDISYHRSDYWGDGNVLHGDSHDHLVGHGLITLIHGRSGFCCGVCSKSIWPYPYDHLAKHSEQEIALFILGRR